MELQSKMKADSPPATIAPSHPWPIFLAAFQQQPLPPYLVLVVRASSLLQPVGLPAISPDPVRVSHLLWVPPPISLGIANPLPTHPLPPASPCHVTSGDALCLTLPVIHLCRKFLRLATGKSWTLVSVRAGSPCLLLHRASN